MGKTISNWLFRFWGWELEVNTLPLPKKCVYCVIPHTSNWDFPVGLLVRSILELDIKYMAKDSLFRPPLGAVFRWLGGYPVDRSRRHRFVDAVVDIFNEKEEFAIAIAPEGTRKRVDKLKTGFYYIAKGAGVPIILTRLDWGNKRVVMSEPFFPTDDKEADFAYIDRFFAGTAGKKPEKSYRFEATK